MRIKRSLPIIVGVLAVGVAVALLVQLRKHAPPEPARLLPSADGFFYFNLNWVRKLKAFDDLPPVSHDAEYQRFVDETGFEFERDLDEAAFAVHYPPAGAPRQPDGEPASPRFSEVFVGKIHGEKLKAYLRKISVSAENFHSIEIYNIPHEGRMVRVAVLGVDSVAVSNTDDANVIRGMVERSRKLASPFGGPALLRQHYKHVPIASLAWGILSIDPQRGGLNLGGPLDSLALAFSKPAVAVVSGRYLRALHLKFAAFTGSPEEASGVAERLSTFLTVFHAAEASLDPRGTDEDVKTFFESLKVEQVHEQAVLTATVPAGFLRKALAEPPGSPPAAAVEPPAPPSAKRQHKRTGPK